MDNIRAHEQALTAYALGGCRRSPGCASSGPRHRSTAVATISFALDGMHPHDVAQLLDEHGIAVRAGHHCARPVCVRYGMPATTRASFGVYTTAERDRRAGRAASRRQKMFQGDMSMPMESMYQQIILDHYKHPQHRGLPEAFDAEVHHVNPTCGDEVPCGCAWPRRRSPTWLGRRGLLDQPGLDLGDERAGGRQAGDEAHGAPAPVPRADAVASGELTEADEDELERRGRVRGRLEVPGAGQVRAAGLDGDEERRAAALEARLIPNHGDDSS